MPSPTHLNTQSGSPAHKSLYSIVSIVPPNTSLAYISTQWASDPATGELMEGVEDDLFKQAAIVWGNIVNILQELGCEMKDIVHRNVSFNNFGEGFGRDVVEGQMSVIPDEWKGDIWKSSLSFNGVSLFHKPGMCYSVDLIVAVPNK